MLFANVREGSATDEERARFGELHQKRSREILDAPEDELFEVRDVTGAEVPPRAFVHVSVECAECGEPTMETRIRRFGGRELCPPWAIRGRSAPMRIGSRSDTAAAAD